MKKFLKWAAIVFGLLAVVCCGIGLVLPGDWNIETSVVMKAKPEEIHALISRPRTFVTYADAWQAKQPEYADIVNEYTFSEVEEGVGAWWISESEGSKVRIEITKSDPQKGIWYEGAIQQDEVNDHGSITFEAVEGGTKVTWVDTGTLPPVVGGFLVGWIESALEPFFHGMLLEAKAAVESGGAEAAGPDAPPGDDPPKGE
jgi:hypothetical protein